MTEQNFNRLFTSVGDQLQGLSATVRAQGVARVVKEFDGDSKYFKEWVKSIEKYARLVGLADESIRLVAYQASKGPVSDFLKRYMDAHQDHGWDRIKGKLRIRYGEIINRQHALLLLRKVRQKVGESVKVYSESLIELAEDGDDVNNMFIESM